MSEPWGSADEQPPCPAGPMSVLAFPAVRGIGLSTEQVALRTDGGRTADDPAPGARVLGALVRAHLFTRVNAVAGLLCVAIAFTGPVQDALFVVVMAAATALGVIQEFRARRTTERLAAAGESRPRGWRDGKLVPLGARELVLDDVVELEPGDRVLVDGRIVGAEDLEVDESPVPGEADPVVKQRGDPVRSGGFVVAGTGAYVVTGAGARAARFAAEPARFTLADSELGRSVITHLMHAGYVLVPASIALVIGQLTVGRGDLREAVRDMVGALLPMLPGGLVLFTSMAFSVAVIRLGRQRCLVRQVPGIERIGRVDTVCMGTAAPLTEAAMDVEAVHTLDEDAPVAELLGALSRAEDRPDASMRAIAGRFPAPAGRQILESRSCRPSLDPGWSGATVSCDHGRAQTWLLGAPDLLLPGWHSLRVVADSYDAKGMHVLLLARSDTGLAALLAAPDAVPEYADPVALVVVRQRVGPEAAETLRRLDGQAVAVETVSERTGPQRRRAVVGELQARGHRVAMVGHGVEDLPALRQSDTAVSSGSGTAAARSAAQLVLPGPSLSALPSVIAEGRRLIGSVERIAALFLTKAVFGALLALAVVVADVPYPFLPRQHTLIAFLGVVLPALFLVFARGTDRLAPPFAGRGLRFAAPAGALAAAATCAAYVTARTVHGGDPRAAASAGLLSLFLATLWVLAVVVRPFGRRGLLLVAGVGLVFLAVLLAPPLREFFRIAPLGAGATWTAVAAAAAAGLGLETVWAGLRRRAARVEPVHEEGPPGPRTGRPPRAFPAPVSPRRCEPVRGSGSRRRPAVRRGPATRRR
ncbi:P-type ATPase [Streptomyces sp. NPDC003042]